MKDFDAQITFCYTQDLAATARFYEEIMGLLLALDQGTCRIYRVAGARFSASAKSRSPPGRTASS